MCRYSVVRVANGLARDLWFPAKPNSVKAVHSLKAGRIVDRSALISFTFPDQPKSGEMLHCVFSEARKEDSPRLAARQPGLQAGALSAVRSSISVGTGEFVPRLVCEPLSLIELKQIQANLGSCSDNPNGYIDTF